MVVFPNTHLQKKEEKNYGFEESPKAHRDWAFWVLVIQSAILWLKASTSPGCFLKWRITVSEPAFLPATRYWFKAIKYHIISRYPKTIGRYYILTSFDVWNLYVKNDVTSPPPPWEVKDHTPNIKVTQLQTPGNAAPSPRRLTAGASHYLLVLCVAVCCSICNHRESTLLVYHLRVAGRGMLKVWSSPTCLTQNSCYPPRPQYSITRKEAQVSS